MLTATMAGQTAGTRQKRKRPMMMEFHAVSQLEVTAVFSVTCECRLYLFPTDLWVGPVLFDPAIAISISNPHIIANLKVANCPTFSSAWELKA